VALSHKLCCSTALALAAAVTAPAASAATFPVGLDLGRATVNDRPILGRTAEQVARTFGRPDAYSGDSRLAYLRYGPSRTFSLLVVFRGGRAVSFASQAPSLVEVRTGRLLALAPTEMQRALRAKYRGVLRISDRYGCGGGDECTGTLVGAKGREIRFGLARGVPFVSVGTG
jgi:hypothetical protein